MKNISLNFVYFCPIENVFFSVTVLNVKALERKLRAYCINHVKHKMMHHLLGIERYEYEKCDNMPQGMKHRALKIAFVRLSRMHASSIVF